MTASELPPSPPSTQAPPPPAGWYQDPDGPGRRYWDGARWAPKTAPPPAPSGAGPSKRRGPGIFLLIAAIGGVAVIALVVALVLVLPASRQSDAKDVLRDTRPLVQRSITMSRRARTDAQVYLRTRSTARRRRAVRELNQVISLRRRAIARLEDMEGLSSFRREEVYKRAATVWAGVLRDSFRGVRRLRENLPANVSPGGFALEAQTTLVVTSSLLVRRWDVLLRQTDKNVIAELD